MLKVYAGIWSNDKTTEMAKFYKAIFKGTKLGKTSYRGGNPIAGQGGGDARPVGDGEARTRLAQGGV